jgi:beta propeller repeat protein
VGVFESSLRLLRASAGGWRSTGESSPDIGTSTVSGLIGGFSDYAVIGTELQVTPAGNTPSEYLISGGRVAWLDARNIDMTACWDPDPAVHGAPGVQCFSDLFLFDAASGLEELVTPQGAWPQKGLGGLALSGDLLAWNDNRTSSDPWCCLYTGIFTLDLSTGVETNVAHPEDYNDAFGVFSYLVASGNQLAWLERGPTGPAIIVLDLSTGANSTHPIGSTPSSLALSGDRAVWRVSATNSVISLDLVSGIETLVSSGGSPVTGPAVSGSRVVWGETRAGNHDVYMYDFSSGLETRITDDPSVQGAPDISGDFIVWEDYRNDPGSANSDIYLFDLSTGLEGEVCLAPGRQSGPRISGDRIVWLDDRNSGQLVLFQIR